MNIVLFLHGKAGSGKDTFIQTMKFVSKFLKDDRDANYAKKELFTTELKSLFSGMPSEFDVGSPINIVSFNEGVYRETCRINPNIDIHLLKSDYKYKAQYRELMVQIGDGYRLENPRIWIDEHLKDLETVLATRDNQFIITPCLRYRNELEYCGDLNKKFQGQLLSFSVRIKASLPSRLQRMSKEGIISYMTFAKNNNSETDLDNTPDSAFDCIIDNDDNYGEHNVVGDDGKLVLENKLVRKFTPHVMPFYRLLDKVKG
ncbi:MAG: hypothetical protein WC511_02780 [Candidatus Pacearchaeota archaeon]